MSSFNYTYSFTNGTIADGTEVNRNFTDVKTYVTSELIARDGSIQMTGQLALKASTDPVTNDHAARKLYVDNSVAAATDTIGFNNDVWDVWVPVWTNLTIGASTVIAHYKTMGKLCFWSLTVRFSAWAMGTAPTFTLPVAANNTVNAQQIAIGKAFITSTGLDYACAAYHTPGSAVAGLTNITPGAAFGATSPAPWTGAGGDVLSIGGHYETV